jgi:hypothetical protein
VLAVEAQHEFAADGDCGSQGREESRARAEQQAEGEAGDQCAFRVEEWQVRDPGAGELGEEGRPQQKQSTPGTDLEIQPGDAVNQQAGKDEDLVDARVLQPGSGVFHREAPPRARLLMRPALAFLDTPERRKKTITPWGYPLWRDASAFVPPPGR